MKFPHIFHNYRCIESRSISELLREIHHNDKNGITDRVLLNMMDTIEKNQYLIEYKDGNYAMSDRFIFKRPYETVERRVCITCCKISDEITATKIELINKIHTQMIKDQKYQREVKLAEDIYKGERRCS